MFQLLRVSASLFLSFPYQKPASSLIPYNGPFLIKLSSSKEMWWITDSHSFFLAIRDPPVLQGRGLFFDCVPPNLSLKGSWSHYILLKMSGNVWKENHVFASLNFWYWCVLASASEVLHNCISDSHVGFQKRSSEGFGKWKQDFTLETIIVVEITLSGVSLFSFTST